MARRAGARLGDDEAVAIQEDLEETDIVALVDLELGGNLSAERVKALQDVPVPGYKAAVLPWLKMEQGAVAVISELEKPLRIVERLLAWKRE
jgi:hypothetical protein